MIYRYGEGITTVTFCSERERDIGQSLTKAQDNFVELAKRLWKESTKLEIQHLSGSVVFCHQIKSSFFLYTTFIRRGRRRLTFAWKNDATLLKRFWLIKSCIWIKTFLYHEIKVRPAILIIINILFK